MYNETEDKILTKIENIDNQKNTSPDIKSSTKTRSFAICSRKNRKNLKRL